ncbi:unconventional myosin-XVIIIa-like [Chenopodium quinoa]|uniref:unconventional myosin-XVIIIa-like n=1 Tax=Chenopodium quinoa TaxID=63459 RepID=UPI000B77889D|nr:unconventional myosin-XVIIIa-like [Chenopodium quinoa]
MARTMQTTLDPDYRSKGSGDQTPEGEASGQRNQTALERSPPRAPSTPADSFLEECDQDGDEAVSAPLSQNEEETESDSSASTSESSDDLPPLEDSEEEERKKWKEALNMLPTEKTPKRSSATIRKELAKKQAAAVRAKGGEVGKTFEKDLKRAREESASTPNKTKNSNSAMTPGASAGKNQMRIGGRNERALLRVDGLKRPYTRKREEVKRAKKSATDADNVALYFTIVNELETKAIIMTQASKIQKLEADLKTANQRVGDAETAQKKAEEAQKQADEGLKKADEALKKAQADLSTLQGVSEENTNLKTKVQKLEKEAAQAQINFAATLEAEQNRLVAESDADNYARMKIAWAALYPDKEYGVQALAHRYAEDVVYLREKGEPEPKSFDAWANANTELPALELPGPGEAHEIPSDDEEEDQEEPPAGQK